MNTTMELFLIGSTAVFGLLWLWEMHANTKSLQSAQEYKRLAHELRDLVKEQQALIRDLTREGAL
jgi:hypothetical protein